MRTTCIVALGFDPTPGDPDAVHAVSRSLLRLAAALAQTAHDATSRSRVEGWGGDAAQSFEESVHALRRLGDSAAALASVARALSRWGDELAALQTRAQRLDRLASEAVRAVPEVGDGPLKQLRGQAIDLRDLAQQAARQAERTVRAAGDHVPGALGFWQQVTGVGRLARELAVLPPDELADVFSEPDTFVDEHAEAIGVVSQAAGLSSTAAAFVPGGQPLALGLAGASLAGTAALARHGHKGTTDVVLSGVGLGLGGVSAGAGAMIAKGRYVNPQPWQPVKRGADAVAPGLTVDGLFHRPPGPAPAPERPPGPMPASAPAPARPGPSGVLESRPVLGPPVPGPVAAAPSEPAGRAQSRPSTASRSP